MKIPLLLVCVCFTCVSSDRSDQLPDVNRDHVTTTNTININVQMSPKRHSHRVTQAGPKHPKVEAAHEVLRRRQEEDDFVTCCCFFKLKKLPVR